jgi:hypothetical protein
LLDLIGYVTWNSSAPRILTFYNDFVHDIGEATLLATGTTTITNR